MKHTGGGTKFSEEILLFKPALGNQTWEEKHPDRVRRMKPLRRDQLSLGWAASHTDTKELLANGKAAWALETPRSLLKCASSSCGTLRRQRDFPGSRFMDMNLMSHIHL